MARYIDADVLVKMLNNKAKTDYEMGLYNHGALTQSFIRLVESQETVEVEEVTKCKDCCSCIECGNVLYCTHFNHNVDEEDYCSQGG